jgi:hypothetical protein
MRTPRRVGAGVLDGSSTRPFAAGSIRPESAPLPAQIWFMDGLSHRARLMLSSEASEAVQKRSRCAQFIEFLKLRTIGCGTDGRRTKCDVDLVAAKSRRPAQIVAIGIVAIGIARIVAGTGSTIVAALDAGRELRLLRSIFTEPISASSPRGSTADKSALE